MTPPRFWSQPPGPRAALLAPLAALYAAGTARRIAKATPWRAPLPAISVGNLNVGGTGKTPVVMWLMEHLSAQGITAHVVSRGYGGRVTGPHRVALTDTASEVGDEPILLAAFGPVWVSADREKGARAAVEAGAECILLDDAHQNPGLEKDLSLVIVDALSGFGNGRVIPAGPLREPVPVGLARADHLVIMGDPDDRARFLAKTDLPGGLGASEARLAPLRTGMAWDGMRVLAFAGIGRPEKVFTTLEALGAILMRTRSFNDHTTYSGTVLARLDAEAKSLGAQLVTTEKDAVRLPAEFRRKVLTLPVRIDLTDKAGLPAAVAAALGRPK